ncbi:hypothetical protein G4Z16_15570 [Streptomyces bathyalis]|uniref:Uncharacterized protein n=1 Tax=Streptomyces bathyalis TaxID=2710756 RepID=A0A7T1T732_9ACTN|nr:hypothetical protein [Streptomyces bathyalis]QPP07575.1 hypothetical protein G4Z16_15570 [Streptomyces bathyalis]
MCQCQTCDHNRTLYLLLDASHYLELPGADTEFADTVGLALAASLDGPAAPPDPGQE